MSRAVFAPKAKARLKRGSGLSGVGVVSSRIRETGFSRSPLRSAGFTIIEVLIVLAIAGLIMVVVFLAVPALQRGHRNQSRKTDAKNSLAAFSEFVGNSGAVVPSASCYGSTGCTWLPSKLGYFQATNSSAFSTGPGVEYLYNSGTGFTAPTAPTTEQLYILSGATCATATGAPSQGTARQVAVYYGLEGSVATQCVSQ